MAISETKVDAVFVRKMNEFRTPDKSVGLIEACSKNVVVFAEHMLGMKLYAWQVKFLTEIQKSIEGKISEREFAAITSRQIGKSTSLAILALWATIFNKKPGTTFNNTLVGIVSASDEQSKTLLYEMKKYMAYGNTYMAETYKDKDGAAMFGEEFFKNLLSDSEANNTTTISFKKHDPLVHGPILLAGSKSGSTIRSWPPTAVVLGKTLTIAMIDEAGKIDKITDQFIDDYFLHTGSSTDCVFIYTSTPWQPAGHFYRMVDPDDMYGQRGTCVMFTIDAIALEAPERYKAVKEKFIEPLVRDGKKDEVQRGYYCRFVKGESSYFDPQDIFPSFKDYAMYDKYDKPCDMGVDFGGQVKSRTVITITEYTESGLVRRLYHKTYEVGQDTALVEDIADLRKLFNIQRIIVDDCAFGAPFIRRMEDEKGWEVERMSFRADKVKKYGAFRVFLKKGKIESYADEELKTEMLALEHTPGNRQSNVQHAPGYSDDLIDSFLMSTFFYIEEEDSVTFFPWSSDD